MISEQGKNKHVENNQQRMEWRDWKARKSGLNWMWREIEGERNIKKERKQVRERWVSRKSNKNRGLKLK